MSVDKFGRYTSSGKSKVVRGPKGDGFLLTTDGDYDIQHKRLKLVNNPTDELDAVNLKTLRENTITSNGGAYDAGNKRITNVSDPKAGSDCVNKSYLTNKIPLKHRGNKSYSFNKYSLKDVAFPSEEGDAVNLSFVKNNCLLHDDSNVDVKGAALIHVRDPINGSDCATKTYVDSKGPFSNNTHWVFNYKKLSSVGAPQDQNDAVTLQYMSNNSLCRVDGGAKQFDGKECIISNIAKPLQPDDAVNKRYLKEVLADFGYSIYSSIHKGSGGSLIPAAQWKTQVLSTDTWDELFK